MKKWLTVLLALALMLNLAACGAGGGDGTADDVSDAPKLHLEMSKNVYENEYRADDGTLLFSEYYELPQLELRDEEGKVYAQNENTAGGGAEKAQLRRIQQTFNNEMESVLAALRANAEDMAQSAKDVYADEDLTFFPEGGYWTSELTIGDVYEVEGKLLSIAADGYTYYGGVHPNTYRCAWNFDLTTGEFLSIDTIASEEGDLDGTTLQTCISQELFQQVYEQNLSELYFDDYDSYLSDFPSFATVHFTASGITVRFDNYIIAPYAAGPQVFDVGYDAFYNALSEHAQSLLEISPETAVLIDFNTAETLWTWFHTTTPPAGYGSADETEINGYTYYRAEIPGVSTMAELRELLCRYVDEALADEWIETSGRFAEADGTLYVLCADRGYNMEIASEEHSVTLKGKGGTVTQTVWLRNWDDDAGDWVLTGETETYEYPFTLVDGHAVFSAFPCPY